jgi:hypothetical protein
MLRNSQAQSYQRFKTSKKNLNVPQAINEHSIIQFNYFLINQIISHF